jgi:hypothetical protein
MASRPIGGLRLLWNRRRGRLMSAGVGSVLETQATFEEGRRSMARARGTMWAASGGIQAS